MARVLRNGIRVLFALLIVVGYKPALNQILLEVGHPGLPDEARGDQLIGLWLLCVAAFLLYVLFAPWAFGRILAAFLLTAPPVIGGLLFAWVAALGGPDARADSTAPGGFVLLILVGTALLAVPALLWGVLEWKLRHENPPGGRLAWKLMGAALLVGLAWTSFAAWEVRRERRQAFERRIRESQELYKRLLAPSPPPARPSP